MANRQRSYPRLVNIKDNDIRETVRMLWDKVYEQTDLNSTATANLTAAQSTITNLQSTISSMQKTMTRMAAGGGISPSSTVQGGGSGGTSGGSGGDPSSVEPPSDIPNHQIDVENAITDLTAALIPLAGYCGSFQITKLVAWRLMTTEPNIGLATAKPGSANNCDGYTSDIILYKVPGNDQMVYVFDIITDADGATHDPVWSYLGTMSVSRWSAPIAPAI